MTIKQSKMLTDASYAVDEAIIQLAEVERECAAKIREARANVNLKQSKLSAAISAINAQR